METTSTSDLERIEGPVLRPVTTAGTTPFSSGTAWWTRPQSSSCSRSRPRRRGRGARSPASTRSLLGVKGGGHNIAGTAIPDGGLMIDMSRMRDVTVDAEAKLAHVEAGCLLQDVDRATQEHGLATVLGFISEVGVAGLTLGGGLGYLTRRFGWTVDNLEEVEIVTADGSVRTANREEHSDLFWAVRGGGGNFGVVTRFTFRLHDVGPTVFGGLIAWPFERADDILAAYRKLTAEAPRELSAWLVLIRAPAEPFVPEEWHGKRCCVIAVCYSGDPDDEDAAIAPIRAIGDPAVDLLQELPYTMQQSFLDDSEPKGIHDVLEDRVPGGAAENLLPITRDLAADCPIHDAQIGLLHLGGALNEHDWDDGAVGNRDAQYAIGVNGLWEPGEPDADSVPALDPRRLGADPTVLDRRQLRQLPDRRRRPGAGRRLRQELRAPPAVKATTTPTTCSA